MPAAIRACSDGVLIRVRLTPRAHRDAIGGIKSGPDGDYIQARVRALPEEGKANAALIELLAKTAGLEKSSVRIASGAASRLKTLHITGDTRTLTGRLTIWLKGLP